MFDVESTTHSGIDRYRDALRARANGLPTVSVVCVAGHDVEATVRKMNACYGHWLQFGVELIVVSPRRDMVTGVAMLNGGARVLSARADTPDSEMRSIGLRAAVGDLVMLVDDPATADDNWIAHLRGAIDRPVLSALA